MASRFLIYLAISIVTTSFTTYASDPSLLQDYCVAANDSNNTMFINGLVCKNPKDVTADDFVFRGLNKVALESFGTGMGEKLLGPTLLPGVNNLGITVARVEYELNGISPPHNHPRATEIITVIRGTLYVGFVDGANKLYSKIVVEGDVFVFPQGLVHFVSNIGTKNSLTITAYSSQDPGQGTITSKLFGCDPPISVDLLSKAFQLDPKIVEDLQSKF